MTFLPIVERELRIAARRPLTYWLRFFGALAAIVVMLLTLWDSGSYLSPAMVAKNAFGVLSMLTMAFCLFTGIFQTADCLSSEKREGTLGLLFLTDLRGYDVVLGKLAANCLHSCYGLLAVLPILAIPLLAGGVTAGEFWRVVVVLLTGLFFSLGVGMLISSVTRETRQAMGMTLFVIITLTGLFPAIYELVWLLFKTKLIVPLLWPSLGYAIGRSADAYYNYRTGANDFWGSILTIIGIGFFCLLVASLILPSAWQEKSQSGDVTKGGSIWRRMRFGTVRRRLSMRELMTTNPFHWLAVRDRLSQIAFWVLAGAVAPIWVLFTIAIFQTSGAGFSRMMPYEILMAITCGFCLVFKCFVAAEASRRLSDDRKSGALELLLVTPLSEQTIVDGQLRALRDQFRPPVLLLLLSFLGLIMLRYTAGLGRMNDDGFLTIVMIGNMIVLVTDYKAMGWVGMWAGLRARHHHRAVLRTLLPILVLPWLLYFILGVMGFFNSSGPPILFLSVWYGFCIFNDLFWARRARRGLKREFRLRAAGTIGKRRAMDPGIATEYSSG